MDGGREGEGRAMEIYICTRPCRVHEMTYGGIYMYILDHVECMK